MKMMRRKRENEERTKLPRETSEANVRMDRRFYDERKEAADGMEAPDIFRGQS